MQNPGGGIHRFKTWGKSFPPIWARWLRRTRTLCQSLHTRSLKCAMSRVPGGLRGLVITQHNLPEPCTDFGHCDHAFGVESSALML